MAERCFEDPADRERFLQALARGEGSGTALVRLVERPHVQTFPRLPALSWQPEFVTRLQDGFRPGSHFLHEEGAYYVLDVSSVFEATPLLEVRPRPRRILDLCAAPGGKSTFAWRALLQSPGPRALIANEVTKKRLGSLIANVHRCHLQGVSITSLDPGTWATMAPGSFDLTIVDAPCSGQSLLAKGSAAPGCFHPKVISMNAARQKRILAYGAATVAPGGYLGYMTCTFSPEENEAVVAWLRARFPEFQPVAVPALAEFQSNLAPFPAYRLFPQSGIGAGGFTCLLRREGDPTELPSLSPSISFRWEHGMEAKSRSRSENARPLNRPTSTTRRKPVR